MNPGAGTFNKFLVMANVDGIGQMHSGQLEGDQEILKQQQQQQLFQTKDEAGEKKSELWPPLATLEMQYFKAISLYRRRNYERCVEVCNVMLETGNEQNVPIFSNMQRVEMSMDKIVDEVAAMKQDKDNHRQRIDENCGQEPYYYERVLMSLKQTNKSPTNSVSLNDTVAGSRATNNNWPRMNSNKHCYSHAFNTTTTTIGAAITIGKENQMEEFREVKGEEKRRLHLRQLRSKVAEQRSQQLTMPTWLMEAIWQLKMRALTQRVYIDDLETNEVNDDGKSSNRLTTSKLLKNTLPNNYCEDNDKAQAQTMLTM